MATDALRVLRKRSLEEYDDDYKPLSKRMHSMYLDSPITSEHLIADTNVQGNASTSISAQQSQQLTTDCSQNIQQNIREEENSQNLHYDPDLTSDQNPYYYESNRLLFDLYVERVHRHGQ